MKHLLLAGALLISGCACGGPSKPGPHTQAPGDAVKTTQTDAGTSMSPTDELQAIRNDNIDFATYRPPEATMPTRGRQVMVVAPPQAVELVKRGDISLLDRLVPLLDDKDRIWAAEVMLAALTGNEADLVNDFGGDAKGFIDNFSDNARQRWQHWLDEHRATLQWDAERKQFRAK